jgi:ParB family chromosome partitioning protein
MSSLPSGSPASATPRSRRKFTVDALFTDHRPQAVGVTDLATAKEIRLDRIEADPDQPRRTFDQAKLEELAASIEREGVLQPIAVRYDAERDIYVVIHGERRWRAANLAGLAVIPAVVRDVPVERRLVQQLMENIVRDDLNAVDRAAALRALKSQLGDVPWETVAEAVGIRRSRLFQLLGTEKLPGPAQDDIRSGRLSEKQSRALQGLDPESQEALRVAILEHELPAEEAMRLSRALRDELEPGSQGSAAEVIDRLRTESAPATPAAGTIEAASLLAAIATAASGTRAERAALADAANQVGAPLYDAERLRLEVLALAGSIARAPAAELRPGGSAYGPLAALSGALDAVLNQD